MRHPGLWMLAAMAAAATGPDPDGLVVIDDLPPAPRPEPRHTTPGIVVVQKRDEFGRQPEPVFRPRGWHPDTTYRPNHPRDEDDRNAIAAAQAKRDRKNRKRLQELR